jgi:hypothetical protein
MVGAGGGPSFSVLAGFFKAQSRRAFLDPLSISLSLLLLFASAPRKAFEYSATRRTAALYE